jgi:two-component system cell cycle response regulator
MLGRILIADDRFASRLMLSALFSGAYYDVVQIDSDWAAMDVARREHPGLIVIADGLAGLGAGGLCDQLRRDAETTEALRIVITDLPDPARTAMLINSGADEVIPRSCSDEEVLARVQTLVDHRAKVSALNLREVAARPQPGLSEAPTEFVGSARVALVCDRPENVADWPDAIAAAMPTQTAPQITVCRPNNLPEPLPDVMLIDSRSMGTDATLRLVARLSRKSEPRAMQLLVAVNGTDSELGLKALELGADNLLTLPFSAKESAARITLLLRRKSEINHLHTNLRNGLRSAMTDPLTGLYNRRYALPKLDQYMRDVRLHQRPAAILMADLDHFKWVNDTYGHQAGDAVLTAVAEEMKNEAGHHGFAARMGGEEFIVALPDCGRLAAAAAGRRIRAAVSDRVVRIPDLGADLRVTTSIGVAVAEADRMVPGHSASEDTAALLTRADDALYRAKSAGRNQVVCDLGVIETIPPAAHDRVYRANG